MRDFQSQRPCQSQLVTLVNYIKAVRRNTVPILSVTAVDQTGVLVLAFLSSCFGFSKFFQTNEGLVLKVGHDSKIHTVSNS